MLINAAAIKLTLRRALPEEWRLGSRGNTWNGIAVHGMEWQYMEWNGRRNRIQGSTKGCQGLLQKRWREMSVSLGVGGEI